MLKANWTFVEGLWSLVSCTVVQNSSNKCQTLQFQLELAQVLSVRWKNKVYWKGETRPNAATVDHVYCHKCRAFVLPIFIFLLPWSAGGWVLGSCFGAEVTRYEPIPEAQQAAQWGQTGDPRHPDGFRMNALMSATWARFQKNHSLHQPGSLGTEKW